MRIVLVAVLNLVSVVLYAQWTTTAPVNVMNGNVGIGTSTPEIWFGGAKTFEFSDTRPVFKLSSTSSTGLSTMIFTNTSVNPNNHLGEFHVNYQFNAANNAESLLKFSSYPGPYVSGEVLVLRSDGRVGIGTSSPRAPLEIETLGNGNVQTGLIIQQTNAGVPNNNAGISLDFGIGNNGVNKNIQAKIAVKETSHSVQPKMLFCLWDVTNTMQDRMVIDTHGNVGIGTTSPTAKLTVAGDINSREVNVTVDAGSGPDYVFEKEYNLLSLADIEVYIKQNKHLPEVPSANEMEAYGLNLKEMNLILLKKVEELTLHLIEMKKENDQQQKEIENLKHLK